MTARGPLGMELDGRGICLRALGLWLDPTRAAPVAFLSHAHAGLDAAGSGRALASRETLALMHALGVTFDAPCPIEWDASLDVPVAASFGGGTARLTVTPAGHALGAAQLVVDHPRGRLVYTGDFSPNDDPTHPPGVPIPCDELVLTSTFALPIFRFDEQPRVLASLVDWCASNLDDDRSPIVLAKSPGMAQSIARSLVARGLNVNAHEDVARACDAYASLGVAIGPVQRRASASRGAVLVAPASARRTDLSKTVDKTDEAPLRPGQPASTRSRAPGGARVTVAYASGWALLDAATEQKRADAAFVLADQADHRGLMDLVRATGARVVHVTRGDSLALVHALRRSGVEADAFELAPIDARGSS